MRLSLCFGGNVACTCTAFRNKEAMILLDINYTIKEGNVPRNLKSVQLDDSYETLKLFFIFNNKKVIET